MIFEEKYIKNTRQWDLPFYLGHNDDLIGYKKGNSVRITKGWLECLSFVSFEEINNLIKVPYRETVIFSIQFQVTVYICARESGWQELKQPGTSASAVESKEGANRHSRVSLCTSGWPQAHGDLSASALQGLKAVSMCLAPFPPYRESSSWWVVARTEAGSLDLSQSRQFGTHIPIAQPHLANPSVRFRS